MATDVWCPSCCVRSATSTSTGSCSDCGTTLTAPLKPEKVCIRCGMNVAGRPRRKDVGGRYFCHPCWAEREVATPSKVASNCLGELLACPTCGDVKGIEEMDMSGVCKRCALKLKAAEAQNATRPLASRKPVRSPKSAAGPKRPESKGSSGSSERKQVVQLGSACIALLLVVVAVVANRTAHDTGPKPITAAASSIVKDASQSDGGGKTGSAPGEFTVAMVKDHLLLAAQSLAIVDLRQEQIETATSRGERIPAQWTADIESNRVQALTAADQIKNVSFDVTVSAVNQASKELDALPPDIATPYIRKHLVHWMVLATQADERRKSATIAGVAPNAEANQTRNPQATPVAVNQPDENLRPDGNPFDPAIEKAVVSLAQAADGYYGTTNKLNEIDADFDAAAARRDLARAEARRDYFNKVAERHEQSKQRMEEAEAEVRGMDREQVLAILDNIVRINPRMPQQTAEYLRAMRQSLAR